MKQKNITMQEIADRSGVSITTVSHVINKTRHVNKETKEAVLKTLEEFNYKGSKTKKIAKIKYIGVIIADIREDYYISIIKSIETFASERNVSLIFCDSEDDTEKEKRNIKMMLDRNVSGLILAPIESKNMPSELKNIDITVILIDRQYENHNFLFIGINNLYSSYKASKYLNNNGSTKIGFIGYSDKVYTIKQRILGYKAFLQEIESQNVPEVLSLRYHQEDSYPIIKDFIKNNGINGIICATSSVCYEVLNVMNDMPLNEQRKINIITYDDNKWFDHLKIPVSVISQPTTEIGNAAIKNLISCIENDSYGNTMKRDLFYEISIIDRLGNR